jgi:signal transduction histidine kinase
VIDDLNEANRRLSETLEENAALQARLLASAREAGVLDERARLAREIHDTIAQGLTGVVAQLEAAAAVDHDPELRRRHSDTAVALARESLSEARRSVEALTPGQLDRARLPDAIADMAKRWGETAGVELVLDTTGDPVPLLTELEVVLFRVAQEALVNVGKHAGARDVVVRVASEDAAVRLDVVDDGAGFPSDRLADALGRGHIGVASSRERAEAIGGSFRVGPRDDGRPGTQAAALLPG